MITALLLGSAIGAPLSIDQPLRTGVMSKADAAVVIGIEDYAFVADVPYASRDADAFETWLLYTRGVPREHVQRLGQANREQILAAVSAAASEVGKGGTLWVYWAGHGAASPSSGRRLLLGVDVMADETVFEARAIGVDELESAARSVPRAVMVLDTCYSGLGRSGAALLAGKRFVVPAYASRPANNITLWTAAQADQLSAGYDAAQHGLFTYFAVGALRGWADGEISGERDGEVTLREAQTYVTRALASVGERKQTPELRGEAALSWSLSRGGAKLALGPDLSQLGRGNFGSGDPDRPVAAHAPSPTTRFGSGDPDRPLRFGSGDPDRPLRFGSGDPDRPQPASVPPRRTRFGSGDPDRPAPLAERISRAQAPTRAQARADWPATKKRARQGGPEGQAALKAFVTQYGAARVPVEGEHELLAAPTPELYAAIATLAQDDTLPADERRHYLAIQAESDKLRARAQQAWLEIEAVARLQGPKAEPALRRFVSAYDAQVINPSGQPMPVYIPEVDTARQLLADLSDGTARGSAGLRRQRKAAALLGAGGLTAIGLAALTKYSYTQSSPRAGSLNGLYYTNQVLGVGGYVATALAATTLVYTVRFK